MSHLRPEEVADSEPCPFCGTDHLGFHVTDHVVSRQEIRVLCRDCGATGPALVADGSKHEKDALHRAAVEKWNDRAD